MSKEKLKTEAEEHIKKFADLFKRPKKAEKEEEEKK